MEGSYLNHDTILVNPRQMGQDSGTTEVAVFMIRELDWQKASCWEVWGLVDLHLLHKEGECSTNTLFKVNEPERFGGSGSILKEGTQISR